MCMSWLLLILIVSMHGSTMILLLLVGYLRRCTKTMHGHTNIKFFAIQFNSDKGGKTPRNL